NEGGSVGTSMAQTIQERRDQFHSVRLGEWLGPFNPPVHAFVGQVSGPFLQQTGDPVATQQLALQALANLREQQASSLAYFDVFWVLAVVMVALVFAVLIMKRSVAEKGAHIGGECLLVSESPKNWYPDKQPDVLPATFVEHIQFVRAAWNRQ